MRRWVILLLAAGVLAGVWATSAVSNDVEQVYEQLFGKEARTVAATSDKADDVAFARKLLDNAQSVADSPKFQAYLCEKAYDFAIKDDEGHPTAVEAMGLLAAIASDRRDECEDNVLKVREIGYHNARGRDRTGAGQLLLDHLMNMGDRKMADGNADQAVALYRRASYLAVQIKSPRRQEILVKGQSAIARARIEREMAELAEKLKASPNDPAAARRLLMLLLVESDDPVKATALLDVVDSDEVLRTYLPLAARPPEAVPEAVCIELGDWYRMLAGKASPVARPRMLARARTYYERFVQVHAAQDIKLLKARMALSKLQGELDKLAPPIAGAQSAAPAPAPRRPDDAMAFQSRWYKLYAHKMTWTEAKAFCEKLGGHLVTITSRQEDEYVRGLARQANGSIHIGLTDEDEQGKWRWVTGEKMTYVNWAKRPARGGKLKYAQMFCQPDWQWNETADARCGFLCEWER